MEYFKDLEFVKKKKEIIENEYWILQLNFWKIYRNLLECDIFWLVWCMKYYEKNWVNSDEDLNHFAQVFSLLLRRWFSSSVLMEYISLIRKDSSYTRHNEKFKDYILKYMDNWTNKSIDLFCEKVNQVLYSNKN
jgi:hypothetical protein